MKRVFCVLLVFILASCASAPKKKKGGYSKGERELIAINEQLYQQQKRIDRLEQEREVLEKRIAALEKPEITDYPAQKESAYRDGYELFLKKEFSRALEKFDFVLKDFTNPALAEAALYFKAASLEALSRKDEAVANFELLAGFFPFGSRWEESVLKAADYHFARREWQRAGYFYGLIALRGGEPEAIAAAKKKLDEIKKMMRR